MLPTTNQLPSLGYMHKVVCNCLGIWSSDNEDAIFNVSATEKDRRAALRKAFEAIKKDDGTYGSLDELTAVSVELCPKDSQETKKARTIQSYVNQLSNADFESIYDYLELSQYIETLIAKRYRRWNTADLAVNFYRSALLYYREFVREYACSEQNQKHSYQYFLRHDLCLLTETLTRELVPHDAWPNPGKNARWPLREFADAACQVTGISLHKLHQYHEYQQEKPLGKQAWSRDFTSQRVNTRSKQVIDRLRKLSRMKWETFFPILQPLTDHLPPAVDEKAFAIRAFAAMIAHNINVHAEDCGPVKLPVRDFQNDIQIEFSHRIPSSDLMDLLFNGYPIGPEEFVQRAPNRYQAQIDGIRALPGSLNLPLDIPSTVALIYKNEHRRFIEKDWHAELVNGPSWINEWIRAREAFFANDDTCALSHFKAALEQAKYAAGPLFVPFYIQLCAFCKVQYRRLRERNEEELFDRDYEGLGSDAASYAALLGYAPHSLRDAETLIPRITLPKKFQLINREIDALATSWGR